MVPKDFLDLGSRQAVDAALGRMVAQGKLRRLARGVFDFPKRHQRFGLRSPLADDVAKAIARTTGESICPSGAFAANALGVSTQVPAQAVYLTDGTSRTLHIDLGEGRGFNLGFKHSRRRLGGASKAGLVLQALWFLGRGGVDGAAIATLRTTLGDRDRAHLSRLQWDAPGWMQPLLAGILSPPERTNAKKLGP